MNKQTKLLEKLLIEIATTADKNKKDYFIGGGFAIDLTVGKITRNHHDIDFHPMLEDALWWKKWFEDQGFKVIDNINDRFSEVFLVEDKDGNSLVNMWPFKRVGMQLLIMYQGKYEDAGRHWEETRMIKFEKINIKIENPERVLEQKLRHSKKGEPFREVDVHDFKLLGKKPKI